jgi:isopentenyl-diphosphate delta-isomerase
MSSDPTAEQRKRDHIDLALKSQITSENLDDRFYYEPMLSAHPSQSLQPFSFLGKSMNAPVWISSMTGGTGPARHINQNLGRLCGELGLGMGLGSTRQLLDSNEFFADFDLRELIGTEQPFFINLGIAQIEKLLASKTFDKAEQLVDRLQADGLFIHVNPMQEWLQPEGDHISRPPLETIQEVISLFKKQIIVKEVGQGFGPESIKALLQLPIAAIDFAAAGGTNFAKLELLRSDVFKQELFDSFSKVGHDAYEMVNLTNKAIAELGDKVKVKEIIISGGVKNFLDGYYLINKINSRAVYGQGSVLLKYASESYESLRSFVQSQIQGLSLAQAYLRVK